MTRIISTESAINTMVVLYRARNNVQVKDHLDMMADIHFCSSVLRKSVFTRNDGRLG
jgi:hypothetical protein